ncbi:MAG: copper homeostasis protein CutC [Bacteroidota bacterium]
MLLEICIDHPASALAAVRGGADRLEVCTNLAEGGTTPSAGLIRFCAGLPIPSMVMIRPRAGHFCYDQQELAVMEEEIRLAKEYGVQGVVFGVLNESNQIDHPALERLVRIATPMQITFHRAFDRVSAPKQAMEQLIDAGVQRILTSGQAPTALSGSHLLKQLIAQAENRIIVMPGAGVRSHNVAEIIHATGAHEIHGSASKATAREDDDMQTYRMTDEDEVKAIKEILHQLNH